jgi:predicted DNA-binding transcriptional regulator YafY
MRRADRLFEIIQMLRARRFMTAAQLADELEVSERTIYRDVSDLIVTGVPITGEAGVGYTLDRKFDLPPLMFNAEEIEALILGSSIVQSWADPDLASAAHSALTKIEAVLPEPLRVNIVESALFAPRIMPDTAVTSNLAITRRAVNDRYKLDFRYTRADGETTSRTVHPLGLFYWGYAWTLVAWCETRDDFRNFRLDRMEKLVRRDEKFEEVEGRSLNDFMAIRR